MPRRRGNKRESTPFEGHRRGRVVGETNIGVKCKGHHIKDEEKKILTLLRNMLQMKTQRPQDVKEGSYRVKRKRVS